MTTKKPAILLFHERGDDIASSFGDGWTMDVFTTDFPSFVRDVPAVYEVESGSVHAGRDAVLKFVERHTPRPKARERAAAPPKKSLTFDIPAKATVSPGDAPGKLVTEKEIRSATVTATAVATESVPTASTPPQIKATTVTPPATTTAQKPTNPKKPPAKKRPSKAT